MSVEYEIHEAANIFPLSEETLPELAADIKANGQRVKIQLLDGKVIDGRRRLAACKSIGFEPQTEAVQVSDPVSYVLSLNLHRRHLDTSQRGMVGARAREIFDKRAKERMHAGQERGRQVQQGASVANLPPTESTRQARDEAAAAVNVGGRTVDYATKVLNQGAPELVAAVDTGKLAISTAAKIATLPPRRPDMPCRSHSPRFYARSEEKAPHIDPGARTQPRGPGAATTEIPRPAAGRKSQSTTTIGGVLLKIRPSLALGA